MLFVNDWFLEECGKADGGDNRADPCVSGLLERGLYQVLYVASANENAEVAIEQPFEFNCHLDCWYCRAGVNQLVVGESGIQIDDGGGEDGRLHDGEFLHFLEVGDGGACFEVEAERNDVVVGGVGLVGADILHEREAITAAEEDVGVARLTAEGVVAIDSEEFALFAIAVPAVEVAVLQQREPAVGVLPAPFERHFGEYSHLLNTSGLESQTDFGRESEGVKEIFTGVFGLNGGGIIFCHYRQRKCCCED